MVEIVSHDGGKYVRIDPKNIDFSGADKAQKITDVYAVQVTDGNQQIITRLGEHVETVHTAQKGDWIVFNIGNVKPSKIPGYAAMSEEEQMLARAEKAEAYVPPKGNFEASYNIVKNVGKGVFAKTSSEPRIAVTVPFNFVVLAPWGSDQFVRAGGIMINNRPDDIYGVDKEAFENTYGTPGATKPFSDSHAAQISARKPLVSEAKFTPETVAHYESAAASIREKS